MLNLLLLPTRPQLPRALVSISALSTGLSNVFYLRADAATECKAYSAKIVNDIKDQFPTIWKAATIVDGDDDAQAKFDEIKQVIPSNIKPKGTESGDFSNTTPTYDKSDPDCWYTFNKCTKPKIEGLAEDFAKVPEVRVAFCL